MEYILFISRYRDIMKMVREWIDINRDAIQEIWETQEFKKLPPLE